MRYLRQQSTHNHGIYGNKDIRRNIYGLVTVDSTDKMIIPKGTTAQNITASVNGQVRYNTDEDLFESFQAGSWAPIRRFEPANIVQQALGNGDDVETKFGPLENQDTYNDVPAAAQNIIVLIENVFQLATTNYVLEQDPPTYTAGWYVVFGTPVPTGKPVTVLHNFDK
tara:strand:- start:1578 stop:2081 length:504 start_codon:yes stop_codon:yes gene_type:complete